MVESSGNSRLATRESRGVIKRSTARLGRSLRGTSATAILGALIVLTICLLALLAPWLTEHDPVRTGMNFLAPPSQEHWLGTDELGRDTLTRILHGGRVSILVGVSAAIIATLIGVPLGLLAGYAGGRIETAIVQVANLFIALPSLVLALIITSMVGATMVNIIFVLGFVGWPRMARLVRGQALIIREMLYVEAARASGASSLWIIVNHMMPNVRGVVMAQFALTVSYSIVSSASLSFLGLGIPPPEPDWGSMVRSGLPYLSFSPLMSLAPSFCVGLTVLGFYLLGSRKN